MKSTSKTLLLSTLGAMTLLTSYASTAAIGTKPLNARTGNYVEANIGSNLLYAGVLTSSGSKGGVKLTDFGWNIAAGHLFSQYFGMEAGFMQNAGKINVPFLTTRLQLPIAERFNFITKIGVMAPHRHKDWLGLPFIGIGGSYAVNDTIDVTAQYQGAIYGVAGAGLLSLGVSAHI